MSPTDTYEIDEDLVVEALKRDARSRNIQYSTHGLEAFLPASTSSRPAASTRRPNLRFLNNIIQDTNAHNNALKLRELEHAGDRLRALRGDPPRDKTRQRRHSPDEARGRHRWGSVSSEDERRDREGRRRSKGAQLQEREGHWRRDEDDEIRDRRRQERRQRRRRHRGRDHDSSDSDRSRSRNRNGESARYARSDYGIEDGRRRRDRSHELDSQRKRRLGWDDDHDSTTSPSKRRKLERRRGRDLSRSRSPSPRTNEREHLRHHRIRRRSRSRSRSRDSRERSNKHHRHRRERARSRSWSDSNETRSKRSGSRDHRQTDSSQIPPAVPVGNVQEIQSASGHMTAGVQREPTTSQTTISRSATRSPSIGPPPPGDPNLLGTKSSQQQPVLRRGRGAHSGGFTGSAMDRHFAESYDPRTDVRQPQPFSPENKQGDDWADSMDAMKARSEWKATQKRRLLEAGFSEEEVGRWEKGGPDGMKDEENVKWKKRGEGREWDRGKVVTFDGNVETEVAWMDAVSQT